MGWIVNDETKDVVLTNSESRDDDDDDDVNDKNHTGSSKMAVNWQ